MTSKRGMIVLIGGEKGGTGKSTTATNLCVYLALEGRDVMLVDADPQGTSSNWVARRNEAKLPVVHSTQKRGNVHETLLDLASRYQYVIVDAGGRDSRELRSAMVAADVLYVPVRASQADLETLPTVNELVGQAKAMNPDLRAKALLSMGPTNPMINEIKEAQDLLQLDHFPELQLSDNIIRDRKVYRDALTEGKGVIEMNNSTARAEIELLGQEIFT